MYVDIYLWMCRGGCVNRRTTVCTFVWLLQQTRSLSDRNCCSCVAVDVDMAVCLETADCLCCRLAGAKVSPGLVSGSKVQREKTFDALLPGRTAFAKMQGDCEPIRSQYGMNQPRKSWKNQPGKGDHMLHTQAKISRQSNYYHINHLKVFTQI